MQIQMDDEQKKLAEVFKPDSPSPSQERIVVRFDPETCTLYPAGKTEGVPYRHGRSKPLRGFTLIEYKESPAKTPTGGRYTRRGMTVRRNKDGKRFWGMMRKDSDIVRLRPAEEVGE